MAAKRTRMSASERREQLIIVARGLFAERGFDATSVEEVAARAQVSKPVVYEHFGGKEGLYAVVVDREITTISAAISSAITDPAAGPAADPDATTDGSGAPDASGSASRIAERAAMALLTYIEDSPDGFRILSAGSDRAAGTYSTLLADVAIEVSGILASQFAAHDLDPRTAPLYAQMLVGIVAMPAQWWLENRSMSKEEVAAHMVNLAWNGLRGMKARPRLHSDPADVSGVGLRGHLRLGLTEGTRRRRGCSAPPGTVILGTPLDGRPSRSSVTFVTLQPVSRPPSASIPHEARSGGR